MRSTKSFADALLIKSDISSVAERRLAEKLFAASLRIAIRDVSSCMNQSIITFLQKLCHRCWFCSP